MNTAEAQNKKVFEAQLQKYKKTPQHKPPRVCIMGDAGAGKTWWGLSSDNPFLINSDDGAAEVMAQKSLEFSLDVVPSRSIPEDALRWEQVLEATDFILEGEHDFKNLVIDSLDGIEKLYEAWVCRENNWKNMEEAGYGKAYVFSRGVLQAYLAKLSQIRDRRNMGIIICAHTIIRDVNDPRIGQYSSHTLKLHKNSNPDVREWSDALLFLAYEQKKVLDKGKFNNANVTLDQTANRYLICQGGRGVQAKNRYGLPEELFANDGEELYDAFKRCVIENRPK